MPKELQRVTTTWDNLSDKVRPLLPALDEREKQYIIMRDRLITLLEGLQEELTRLKAKTAADPQAAKDPMVKRYVKEIQNYLVVTDNHAKQFAATAKQVAAARGELVKLQKDVLAVTKAKSGFFSTSKSLPKLKDLSTKLNDFAKVLDKALEAYSGQ